MRTLEIVRIVLALQAGPKTSPQLCKDLGMSKQTVHNVLKVLIDDGLIAFKDFGDRMPEVRGNRPYRYEWTIESSGRK